MDDRPRVGTRLDLIVRFTVDEVQQLTSTATGGTYRLRYRDEWTPPIPWNATSQDVEDALVILRAVSHHGVICWGGPHPDDPINVRFTSHLGKKPQPDLVVNGDELTGGGAVTVTTPQDGGPVDLDTTPTITIKPPKDAEETLTVEALGGGTYQATYTPTREGVHTWAAGGTSTTHGDVTAEDTVTVLPRTIT